MRTPLEQVHFILLDYFTSNIISVRPQSVELEIPEAISFTPHTTEIPVGRVVVIDNNLLAVPAGITQPSIIGPRTLNGWRIYQKNLNEWVEVQELRTISGVCSALVSLWIQKEVNRQWI